MAAIACDKGSPVSRAWPEAQAREQSHRFPQCLLGAALPGAAHLEMKKKNYCLGGRENKNFMYTFPSGREKESILFLGEFLYRCIYFNPHCDKSTTH